MHKNQVVEIIHAHQEELHNHYAVKSLGLFGSVARDEATANSDVDLLIEFAKPVGLFHFLTVKNCLQEWLNQKVDLVTYSALKSPLKEQILKEVIDVA
jgi:predicted nucleotidyltransferase